MVRLSTSPRRVWVQTEELNTTTHTDTKELRCSCLISSPRAFWGAFCMPYGFIGHWPFLCVFAGFKPLNGCKRYREGESSALVRQNFPCSSCRRPARSEATQWAKDRFIGERTDSLVKHAQIQRVFTSHHLPNVGYLGYFEAFKGSYSEIKCSTRAHQWFKGQRQILQHITIPKGPKAPVLSLLQGLHQGFQAFLGCQLPFLCALGALKAFKKVQRLQNDYTLLQTFRQSLLLDINKERSDPIGYIALSV